jgi:hypothetical protein
VIVTRGLGLPAKGNLAVAGLGRRDAGGVVASGAGVASGARRRLVLPNNVNLDDLDDELAVALALLLA